MKNWLKEHKWRILISTALTLLPTLIGLALWNQLPDVIASHWGADGVADGFASKGMAVFGIPAILAVLNILCCMATAIDPKQAKQNIKAMGLVFWIMPVGSLVVGCTMYALAMGRAVDMFVVMPLLLGAMFVFMGNYMPKVTQNSTLGVKIPWTLCNEENWNKTHRFAGKVWVAGGVVLMLTALLPNKFMIPVLMVVILGLSVAPMAYSFRIYRQHRAQGIAYEMTPKTKKQKTTAILSAVLLVAILVFVAGIMFTGDITYTFQEDSLRIEAHYVGGMEVSYDIIDSVELRVSFDVGIRAFGFSSPRLNMGTFENDEFKAYSIYSYNSCESMILLRSGDKVLAINAKTEAETQKLYETLLTKIG